MLNKPTSLEVVNNWLDINSPQVSGQPPACGSKSYDSGRSAWQKVDKSIDSSVMKSIYSMGFYLIF